MENEKLALYEKIQKLNKKCEYVQSVMEGNDPKAKEDILFKEKREYHVLMERLEDQSKNGKSEALRNLASIQYKYFSSLDELVKQRLAKLLKSEDMNTEDAENEAIGLYAEYMLDSIEQSLRSAFLVDMQQIKIFEGGTK